MFIKKIKSSNPKFIKMKKYIKKFHNLNDIDIWMKKEF